MSQPNPDTDFDSDVPDVSTGELPDDDEVAPSGPAVDLPDGDSPSGDDATGDDTEDNGDDGVPDVSHSSSASEMHDPVESHKRANEVFNNVLDGRSAASEVVLDTRYGALPCTIDLSSLTLKTRWDCVKALPDGMMRGTTNGGGANADGEASEAGPDVELESSIIPGGDGMVMMREVVLETLSSQYLSDGDLDSLINNDLPDPMLIEIGMRILEMSLDRGQITGFRFE